MVLDPFGAAIPEEMREKASISTRQAAKDGSGEDERAELLSQR